MNSIEKQKGALIGLGIVFLLLGVLAFVGGIVLIIAGVGALGVSEGIVRLVFGIIFVLLSLFVVPLGIKWLWVALAIKATKGSIAEGNIAKEGGTVNMRKCDKCGTKLADGEYVCSNCGKSFENLKDKSQNDR